MTTEDKLNENTYRHKCSKTIILVAHEF